MDSYSLRDSLAQRAHARRHKKWEGRRGFVTDEGWPFRLDIPLEYQDWILVVVCTLVVFLWCLPCFCGRMHTPCSRRFTNWVYTRLHVFYWGVLYITLFIVMLAVGILPDWTMPDFLGYVSRFVVWVLRKTQSMIISGCILAGFMMALKFRERVLFATGMEHITVFRWGIFEAFGFKGKQRPVELFIWKVDGLQSSAAKLLKANDIFVECHLDSNEPMRTRVHNNAGHSCIIREPLQLNINESSPSNMLTLLVKDQALLTSSELARLSLSTRELLSIEDQTGKRRIAFDYSENYFVPLGLSPTGTIWLAVAPVEEWDDSERTPLVKDDSLLTC